MDELDELEDITIDELSSSSSPKETFENSYALIREGLKKEYDLYDDKMLASSEQGTRFSDALWASVMPTISFTLVGAGGIGSWIAFALARANAGNIIIYDHDRVEIKNLAGQMFNKNHVGMNKVAAVKAIISEYNFNSCISPIFRMYEGDKLECIAIGALDNMSARQSMYDRFIYETQGGEWQRLLIDCRLSADTFQVFALRGDSSDERKKEYKEKWLFSDEMADNTRCSLKSTTFLSMAVQLGLFSYLNKHIEVGSDISMFEMLPLGIQLSVNSFGIKIKEL